jgi:hypothetical protein
VGQHAGAAGADEVGRVHGLIIISGMHGVFESDITPAVVPAPEGAA